MRALAFALIAAPVALLAAAPAFAQDGKPYVGAGYTHYSEDDLTLGTLTGRVGYAFNPNFAVEGEGGIGIVGDEVGPIDVKIDGTLGVFGVARAPINDRFSLHARAGYQQTWVSAEGFGVTADEDDGSFAIGAGAELAIDDANGFRADYTRLTEDGGSDTFSVTYVRRF
jgi:outer membrane immunogenic protein